MKFKQQMEFQSFQILYDFKKVYMRGFFFCEVYFYM